MEVNSFQILLVDVTYLKCGTWCANNKWKPEYMRHRPPSLKPQAIVSPVYVYS